MVRILSKVSLCKLERVGILVRVAASGKWCSTEREAISDGCVLAHATLPLVSTEADDANYHLRL